jgi:hypothetical protein
MPEMNIQLKGRQAVAVLLVLAAAAAARFASMRELRNDPDLMREVRTHLASETLPQLVDRLRDGQSVPTDDALDYEPVVSSVRASYPPFDFSVPKDVVVRVAYSLPNGEPSTVYFLFSKGAFGWRFKHKSDALGYYLNFS